VADEPMYIQFKLGDYLRPGTFKVALGKGAEAKFAATVPELIAQTNAFSTKNRPGCVAKLLDSNPKELFLHYNVTCNLKISDPAGHDVKVRFDLSQVTDESTAKNLEVKVSCSCPAFVYWGAQWHTHQRDSLEGEPRPLLAPPTERLDLRGHFVICKHCATVFERILPSVQHNIIKIIREREVERRKPTLPPTKERLLKEQERSRKRQEIEKKRRDQNKRIEEKLLEGLRRREQQITEQHVVKRDEPATPAEKKRIPRIPPTKVPAPAPPAPPPVATNPPASAVKIPTPAVRTPAPVDNMPPSPTAPRPRTVKRTEPATTPAPTKTRPVKEVPVKSIKPESSDNSAMTKLLDEMKRETPQKGKKKL
jgi:hypothetical protein